MSGNYASTYNEPAVTSAYQSAGHLLGKTTVKGRIYDVNMSQDGTVGDQMLTWTMNRFTGAPTGGGAVAPQPLDPDDPATALLTGAEAATAEGTQTADTEFFEIGVHMRQTVRFYFNEAERIIMPKTATAGISLRVKAAAYTGTAKGGIHHNE